MCERVHVPRSLGAARLRVGMSCLDVPVRALLPCQASKCAEQAERNRQRLQREERGSRHSRAGREGSLLPTPADLRHGDAPLPGPRRQRR